jgi:hypothetical protein
MDKPLRLALARATAQQQLADKKGVDLASNSSNPIMLATVLTARVAGFARH